MCDAVALTAGTSNLPARLGVAGDRVIALYLLLLASIGMLMAATTEARAARPLSVARESYEDDDLEGKFCRLRADENRERFPQYSDALGDPAVCAAYVAAHLRDFELWRMQRLARRFERFCAEIGPQHKAVGFCEFLKKYR